MSVTTGWIIAICWIVLLLGIVVALYVAGARSPVRDDEYEVPDEYVVEDSDLGKRPVPIRKATWSDYEWPV